MTPDKRATLGGDVVSEFWRDGGGWETGGHIQLSAREFDEFARAWGLRQSPIPEGAMRVGPGTDAVVWRICPSHEAEL